MRVSNEFGTKKMGSLPVFEMLVGLPGSGKSTHVKEILSSVNDDIVVISTDAYIEERCKEAGITYSEGFQTYIKEATAFAEKTFSEAVADSKEIVIDQTNLTRKTRAAKLRKVPDVYYKVALYIEPPPPELHKRMLDRPGKVIPDHVLESMRKNIERPTLEEGFDEIITLSWE